MKKKTRKASKQSRDGEPAPPENASFQAWRPEFDLQNPGKQLNGAWWWGSCNSLGRESEVGGIK